MILSYDRSIYDEAQTKLTDYIINTDKYQKYEIEFPNGVNEPPALEVARIIETGNSFENKVLIAKYSILKKTVKVKLNGEYVDPGFQLNSINDDWDNIPTFKNHKMAINTLLDVCMGIVLKNYLPSLISMEQVKA